MRCYKVEAPGIVLMKGFDRRPAGWSDTPTEAYERAIEAGLAEQSAAAAAFEAAAERVRQLREAMVREVLG